MSTLGGSPNSAKDGVAPLSGVIETDWSPYTFTMNWRFTRRNHWVRFEANEPICFIQPVQRAALERMDPKLVPLASNPDLQAADATLRQAQELAAAKGGELFPSVDASLNQQRERISAAQTGIAGYSPITMAQRSGAALPPAARPAQLSSSRTFVIPLTSRVVRSSIRSIGAAGVVRHTSPR